jgi:phosphoenolpyruvate phosphomutase
MKAIILNSGVGQRMGTLTENSPKCLVSLTETETILDHQIRLLFKNRITDLLITTGPFSVLIEKHIAKKYPSLNVSYIKNPLYNSTNYIYSLHLIPIQKLKDNILLIHGDLVIEKNLFKSILSSPYENCVLVNKDLPQSRKDFKGRVINGQVMEIGVKIFNTNCFTLMPFYKMSEKFFLRWKKEIDVFIAKGTTDVYAENAFNAISHQLHLFPHYYLQEFCMEIDTPEDLELAQNWISRRR